MASLVSNHFRVSNAEQFYESFSEAAPTYVYLFIGRTLPWADDVNPSQPGDTANYIDYEIWKHILGFKRVTSADVSHVIPRVNWTSGTVYAPWSHVDPDIYDKQFYVLTDDYRVYKCLNNNRNLPSTIKPTGYSNNSFTTSDGYTWKFMYDITAAQAIKFLTTNYMPVQILDADGGEAQYDVQTTAANGAIESVLINSAGSAYVFRSNTAQTGNTSTITLDSGASAVDNYYNGSVVYITSGTGAGQLRTIIDYTGASRLARISPNFTTAPDSSSTYRISPKVTVTGDGVNFSAYATGNSSGAVTGITILNRGQSYARANGTVTANAGGGCSITPVLSPPGGHGSNAVEELGGRNVMITVKLSGSESNTFTTNNDFRFIGLIINPKERNGGHANALLYDQMYHIRMGAPTGSFQKDEIVRGGTSGATGYVVSREGTDLTLTCVTGNFTNTELLTGNTSGATCTANGIIYPEIKERSGRIIFLDHRSPIVRSASQSESLSIIAKF